MPGSREITLLRNPVAGRGRARRVGDAALARLRAAGVPVQALEGRDAGETADLARAAVRGGTGALVVVGGDGTVHLALQAVAETGVPLAVVRAGRRNRAATALDQPAHLEALIDGVLAGRTRTSGLVRSAGRWSVHVATAAEAGADRRSRGLAGRRTSAPIEHVVDLDGEQRRVVAESIVVGASFVGHGDCQLDVAALGRPADSVLRRLRARRVTLAAPGVVGWSDGEYLGRLPLTIEAVPGVLTLLG